MGLKEYKYNGLTFQFHEEDAPKGAVPVETKQREPNNKQVKPSNKSK